VEPAVVEVAVRLGVPAGRTGEWVADAAAFDASGADALWLEAGAEHELDALVLAGALAVVTFRARLVVVLPEGATEPAVLPGLARSLGTVGRLCHGRLVVVSAAGEGARLAALVPGMPVLARVARRVEADCEAFVAVDAASSPEAKAAGNAAGGGPQRWMAVPAPQGRAAWRQARADAAERGARGVVVPADPRLLDMLRNPDEPDERTDLMLAQG
jgi:hypothetical protein